MHVHQMVYTIKNIYLGVFQDFTNSTKFFLKPFPPPLRFVSRTRLTNFPLPPPFLEPQKKNPPDKGHRYRTVPPKVPRRLRLHCKRPHWLLSTTSLTSSGWTLGVTAVGVGVGVGFFPNKTRGKASTKVTQKKDRLFFSSKKSKKNSMVQIFSVWFYYWNSCRMSRTICRCPMINSKIIM